MLTAIAQTKISAKVFGQPGYSTDIALTPDELALFEEYVSTQWLSRIRERHPALAERFAEVGMRNYHQLADQVDHAALWPKRFRVFPREWVTRIKASPVMARLREAFGEFSISDVVFSDAVEVGREEVYWRLVRPHAQGDVGPLHADKWFHESLSSEYGMTSPDLTSAKIWLPIFCEPGLNGIIVVPGSHLREWRYRKVVESNGHVTPQLDEDIDPKSCVLLPTTPGTLVIFNERLLHRGAVNLGKFSRVSIEITMVFR
jgi:hypothetical protein